MSGSTSSDELPERKLNTYEKAEEGPLEICKYLPFSYSVIGRRELSDVVLRHSFELDVRKNGEKYESSSIKNFRHSMNHHLKFKSG